MHKKLETKYFFDFSQFFWGVPFEMWKMHGVDIISSFESHILDNIYPILERNTICRTIHFHQSKKSSIKINKQNNVKIFLSFLVSPIQNVEKWLVMNI